jgi:hypothetical protein
MWEPGRLWASEACYRDSFTFLIISYIWVLKKYTRLASLGSHVCDYEVHACCFLGHYDMQCVCLCVILSTFCKYAIPPSVGSKNYQSNSSWTVSHSQNNIMYQQNLSESTTVSAER